MTTTPEAWEEFRDGYGSYEDLLQRGYLDAPLPVPTGIGPLDAVLSGGMRCGLHTLGGEPGAGKSALSLFIAMQAALRGANAFFVSLEMQRVQCVARCASLLSLSGVRTPFRWADWEELGREARRGRDSASRAGTLRAFVDGFTRSDPVASAVYALKEACPGLCIADAPELHDLRELGRAVERAAGCGASLVVVDYLQNVSTGEQQTEYDRISGISRALNALGNCHGIPVLALSSMNRQSNAKTAPDMHGLRGSGQLEYDSVSSWVILKDGDPRPDGSQPVALHVVKNRFGPSGAEPLRFDFDGAHNNFTW